MKSIVTREDYTDLQTAPLANIEADPLADIEAAGQPPTLSDSCATVRKHQSRAATLESFRDASRSGDEFAAIVDRAAGDR